MSKDKKARKKDEAPPDVEDPRMTRGKKAAEGALFYLVDPIIAIIGVVLLITAPLWLGWLVVNGLDHGH